MWPFTTHAQSLLRAEKKCLPTRLYDTIILIDSARKRNRKNVLANYYNTRINMTVGWNWRKRWEFKLMLKCHCACSPETGTCIINDALKQATHKKYENTRFWLNDVKQRSILMFWRSILTFNAIFSSKNHHNQRHYTCTCKDL